MVILAIETTGPLASAALYNDGEVRCVQNTSDFSHLQECVPMVKQILSETGIEPQKIDAIAVSCGPGSFTGIRIGMATAKGFAQIWDKPMIEVPTLESFAYIDAPLCEDTLICPVFDARRNQVYSAAFARDAKGNVRTLIPEGAYALDDYLEMIKNAIDIEGKPLKPMFFGDGSRKFMDKISEAFGDSASFADDGVYLQSATNAVRFAAKLYEEGNLKDCFTSKPNYLRAAEPDRKKGADA